MSDPASQPRTRQSLLLRLRDHGDAEAWQLFTDVYAPLVYRYVRRQGLQEADAADVSQEVLTQVARSIGTFNYQPERGRFRDWLGAVVRSKLVRFYQRQSRSPRAGGNGAQALDQLEAPTEDIWAGHFDAHVLRAALERIRPDYEPHNWRAFEMVWLEDRPAAEVARELHLPPSAVYTAKYRALKRLREEVLALADDVPHLSPPCEPRGE